MHACNADLLSTLPWCTRLKIAVGAAKGLAFLHEADTPVIYRDFKASNILLDSVSTSCCHALHTFAWSLLTAVPPASTGRFKIFFFVFSSRLVHRVTY